MGETEDQLPAAAPGLMEPVTEGASFKAQGSILRHVGIRGAKNSNHFVLPKMLRLDRRKGLWRDIQARVLDPVVSKRNRPARRHCKQYRHGCRHMSESRLHPQTVQRATNRVNWALSVLSSSAMRAGRGAAAPRRRPRLSQPLRDEAGSTIARLTDPTPTAGRSQSNASASAVAPAIELLHRIIGTWL